MKNDECSSSNLLSGMGRLLALGNKEANRMRLIDADEIRIKPEYMHDICGVAMIRVEDIARILNDMPTIRSEPRRKGEWKLRTDERFDIDYYKCSECGYEPYRKMDISNFCPNCGADMRGEQDE